MFSSFPFFPYPNLCPSLPALTLCYNKYPLTWSCNTDISGLCSYLVSGQIHPRHRLVISNSSFPNRILHLYLLNSYFPPLFPILANNKIIQITWMDTLTFSNYFFFFSLSYLQHQIGHSIRKFPLKSLYQLLLSLKALYPCLNPSLVISYDDSCSFFLPIFFLPQTQFFIIQIY